MNRRKFLIAVAATAALPAAASANPLLELVAATAERPMAAPNVVNNISGKTPSALTIERSLSAPPAAKIKPSMKAPLHKLKRMKSLRHIAPSIDIQSINFAFGSARIPAPEHWKVEQIAQALHAILGRNQDEFFLIEGHTDAVGSYQSNMQLSRRRAAALRRILVQYFGVPRYALDTVGYGEEDLLVPTPYADWRNRRVTLRRITDVAYR